MLFNDPLGRHEGVLVDHKLVGAVDHKLVGAVDHKLVGAVDQEARILRKFGGNAL